MTSALECASYRAVIDATVGRVVSQLDAEPTSRSYGSFDRTWWCWKFSDFSAARFQEGAFTLAWLYTSPLAPDGYRGSEKALTSASAAVSFWKSLQHGDGSFDEAYPFERSLAATAFTAFYVGSAAERLASHWTSETASTAAAGLEAAGKWLDRADESHAIISNHLAAAAAALQVIGDVLGTDRFIRSRNRFLDIILREANLSEGWFREYDGADPGYQSHGMFYLADIWRRTNDRALGDALVNGCKFLSWFAHPDGTLGGEYASRGTKFAYPAAFEMLAKSDRSAAALAAHTRATIAADRAIGPTVVDAWNLFPLLNNYLFAAEAAVPLGETILPWQAPQAEAVFNGCGLAVLSRGPHVIALGAANGGAIKVWRAADASLVYEDCGYAAGSESPIALSQASSTWTSSSGRGTIEFAVRGAFRALPQKLFDPVTFLGFRMFSLTVGRVPSVARWLKQLLVGTLIGSRATSGATLSRAITIHDDGAVVIADDILDATHVIALSRQVPVHMGSSRYAHRDDWRQARMACPAPERVSSSSWRRSVTIEATR